MLNTRTVTYLLVNMIIRGRFLKRLIVMFFVFGVSFFVSVLIFGDLRVPRIMHLTDLSTCPACYGISLCPELYSSQIILDNHRLDTLLFNLKNIYHGYTKSNRRVILKKLAHKSELKRFDSTLCKNWDLPDNCKTLDLLNATNIDKKIEELVQYNFSTPGKEPQNRLIFCPYAFGIHDFILPTLSRVKMIRNYKSDLINVWTMLSLNPEPIVIQAIPKSKGWHVPGYAGVCGRLEVVAYEGEPLTHLYSTDWHRKLVIAKNLIDAAMDFTFKHERFRFYLMDWVSDNIVVNEKDEVTFVDLEDVIVLDKYISPKSDLPKWYQRYSRDNLQDPSEFSVQNMCTHHLSDHNIFYVCDILAGEKEPFLNLVPADFKEWPQLSKLLQNCLNGTDRFKTGTILQKYLAEILIKENFGAVS